ncbi:hypothetical protein, partial [Ruminococcus sp.]
DMVYYILVGIFSSNLLYHKKDCFPTLFRVVAVFFYCAFFYSAIFYLRYPQFVMHFTNHVGAGVLDSPHLFACPILR